MNDALLDALREVHDPEVGIDVVSLGLVYDARLEAGDARVTMTLTSAACPLGDFIRRDAEWRLRKVPGVTTAHVDIVFDPPWTPARMSDEARALLGAESDA
jgi:metal-sulfur cluster biosynthetic enzyme